MTQDSSNFIDTTYVPTGGATTAQEKGPKKELLMKVEVERYGYSKPRRIVLKARIIHD